MNRGARRTCSYLDSSAAYCAAAVQAGGDLCFWHDPAQAKTGSEVRRRLERWAATGHSMEGFQLQRADLHGIHLTPRDPTHGYNLSHADLSRANLNGAHLFHIDLRGSTLLKANLEGANLNRALLGEADLLGVDLEETRLEHVDWGRRVKQEAAARRARHRHRFEEAQALFVEAEEVYRTLSKVSEAKGYYGLAGRFYQREMIMRRMQLSMRSWEWWRSKMVDVLCGYGERADRVIGFSGSVMLVCALLFFLVGVIGPEGRIGYTWAHGFGENLLSFLTCAYFSVVTFTTLGYGDITPLGVARLIATIEAFVGAFSMALFVVVFVKKMTR